AATTVLQLLAEYSIRPFQLGAGEPSNWLVVCQPSSTANFVSIETTHVKVASPRGFCFLPYLRGSGACCRLAAKDKQLHVRMKSFRKALPIVPLRRAIWMCRRSDTVATQREV